jgi:hypothetical protein
LVELAAERFGELPLSDVGVEIRPALARSGRQGERCEGAREGSGVKKASAQAEGGRGRGPRRGVAETAVKDG